jgi:biopolymer transport protein ExbB/TolQ
MDEVYFERNSSIREWFVIYYICVIAPLMGLLGTVVRAGSQLSK